MTARNFCRLISTPALQARGRTLFRRSASIGVMRAPDGRNSENNHRWMDGCQTARLVNTWRLPFRITLQFAGGVSFWGLVLRGGGSGLDRLYRRQQSVREYASPESRYHNSYTTSIPTGVIYGNKETEPNITCGYRCAFPCTLGVLASQPKESNWGLSSAIYNAGSVKRARGCRCEPGAAKRLRGSI